MKWVYLSCAMLLFAAPQMANAEFFGRLETAPGSGIYQAYYDDQLDITWVNDANLSGGTWESQLAWVANLEINGVGGWRLPNMDVNGDDHVDNCVGPQIECMDHELRHLYTYGAGNVRGQGITPRHPEPFINIRTHGRLGRSSPFWSSTEYAPDPENLAWAYNFFTSNANLASFKTSHHRAWAVHDGDVGGGAIAPDAAIVDAMVPDSAIPDAMVPDAAIPDAMTPDMGSDGGGGNGCLGNGSDPWWLFGLVLFGNRRRKLLRK